MNKRVFTMMIALLLAAFVPKAYGQANVWDGSIATEVPNDGTTYTITTGAELAWVAEQAPTNTFSGKTIKLTGDIDLGNQPWTPIGNPSENSDGTKGFDGTFDGAGFVISRLSIIGSARLAGLFGYITKNGTVKNLGVTGSITSDTEYAYAGGIAGQSIGKITNCYTNVTVAATGDSKANAGGIVGMSEKATTSNCYALGNCTATSDNGIAVAGGIVGDMGGSLSNCYATGTINGKIAGGIAGKAYVDDVITGCIALNKGGITGSTGNNRIVGGNGNNGSATITNCYASPLITGIWTDGADLNGADLTTDNFITPSAANNAFKDWSVDSWDLTAANLPTLKGFEAVQSVAARADFLKKVIIITTKEQLVAIKDPSGSYVLADNIDLDNQSWTPIGNDNSPFTGTFDGAGYVISGLSITGSSKYAGLFGYIGKDGTVKNLGVTGSITSDANDGMACAGGIAGQSEGKIMNCYTDVTVTATGQYANAGGIAGAMSTATISNCFALGDCTANGDNGIAGGIVGNKWDGSLSYCYATGTIKGKIAGGIAGQAASDTQITGCIALNKEIITGEGSTTNRILGQNDGTTITNCYASPLISGTWTDKGATTSNGADLTTDNFITSPSAENGAFKDWSEASWDLTTTAANLPTLKGFKAAQPVPAIERAKFLPTLITNQAELVAIKDLSGSYVLANNIPLSGDWKPIGDYSSPFTGTFDGAGYVISGLSITGSTATYVGLFGFISATATIKNLGVTGTVTGNAGNNTTYVGGIVGQSEGTITNCYTNVAVAATGSVASAGGIVGYMSAATATTSNCFALGNCTATGTDKATAGGIVANKAGGSLSYCYATGTIETKGNANQKYTGGIVGQSTGTLTGCIALNKGGIRSTSDTNRILGQNDGTTITNCYASPLIPGTWKEIGADKQSGADLTTENFVTSNDAFAGDWTTSGYWAFDNDKTYLPKLLTTHKKEIGGQSNTERTLYFESPVTIDNASTYDATTHGGKNLVVTATGILTVTTDGASISSIDIKEGGQVNTTKPLIITKKLTTARTLANKWITFGSPLKLTPKSAASMHVRTGYSTAAAENQVWKAITIASGATLPATPYLLAAENAGTALTLTATGTTDAPVTIPAFKQAETSEAQNNGIFLFRMNPALSNQTMTNIYVLSDDGYRFELHETAYVVKPFECYLIANAATRAAIKSLRAGGDLPTGNTPVLPTDAFRIWGAGGQLHLDATTPADVAIYNLSGQLLHRFRLDGSRTLTLARGIYLVRSNNITYKVSL